ncbi:hypothetical protein [Craterilacuibacter sp. RT1T]|uniref:hypothetical protein n=1 Tax=Craterilacuibacter sp. RT1T TaxID=2942211 RepID=UPI0020BF420D|nr:hypothetical protein [Craterilacuibacter sp. RT1T]MCL6262834.1 hypothetical protein [Craterilacuibacter sp. RT1T]
MKGNRISPSKIKQFAAGRRKPTALQTHHNPMHRIRPAKKTSTSRHPLRGRPIFYRRQSENLLTYQNDRIKQKNTAGEKKPNFDLNWASFLALSLTILTAVYFGAGKAYRESYFASFGIPDTAIPLPFHDIIYLGLIKQSSILITTPILAIYATGFIAITIGALTWSTGKIPGRIEKLGRAFIKEQDKTNTLSPPKKLITILDTIYFITLFAGAILLTEIVSYAFIIEAAKLGKKEAQEEIYKISHQRTEKIKPPYITIERTNSGKTIS